jgi:N-acetylmuramoyl-L-alanine amidase
VSRTTLAHHWQPSPNFEPRRSSAKADLIILHYTGMQSSEAALKWLCNQQSGVSSHYLIDDAGAIVQMVDEDQRAWHAGVASWKGVTDINSCSIGIELHNPGHEFGYVDFTPAQVSATIALCRDIAERHAIASHNILAHSDVAPLRKIDPGEKFPWKELGQAGVGHWVEPWPIENGETIQAGEKGKKVDFLRRQLALYGYGIEPAGSFDSNMTAVVKAFQRHFRQERVDGVADSSTIHTLERLIVARARS